MTSWTYIVVGLCLLLLLWLLVQEVRRQRRSLLEVRIAALVLAVGTLAGLVLPLGHWRKRQVVAASGTAVSAAPAGIVAVGWRRRIGKGELLRVQGRWAGARVKILLIGMGTVLDSADVGDEFELRTVPSVVGRAVFGLIVLAGRDTVEREEVPVEVVEGKPLKILVLANSPDFDNTFLMNWLGKEGNAVAGKIAVSRGKYQVSFVNMERRSLETPDGFDLVIADSSEVTPVVWRQVEEKGLGLLIRVDSAVRIGRPGMRVLERDSSGRVVVGVILAGTGKVIYSASNTSYSQWLAGRKDAYAAHWTMLLRQAAKAGEPEDAWNWVPDLPRVDEPEVLELESERQEPEGLVGNAAVYLAEDAALSWHWKGRYWPVSSGWQAVGVPGGDTSWAYVWGGKDWTGIRQAKIVGEVGTGKMVRDWVVFPRWVLYVVFLLSVFFLWVERKMGGMNG
jgi:hypothetical protein